MSLAKEKKLHKEMMQDLRKTCDGGRRNLEWLWNHLHPYFFVVMQEETEAMVRLAFSLEKVLHEREVIVANREKALILARLNLPGSFYESLKMLRERDISYAELTHSYASLPGSDHELEIQRYEFERKSHEEIASAGEVVISAEIRKSIASVLRLDYPLFPFKELESLLRILWLNHENHVLVSPAERIARLLWLYHQGKMHDGLYLDVENTEDLKDYRESRLLFSVGNPSQVDFLAQTMEVFNRLDVGVQRCYCFNISTGVHPYFLGSFYVRTRDGKLLERDSTLFDRLKKELYNTQILSTTEITYTNFVANRVMTGEEATLTNAFVSFCHTNLAHNQPDRFDLEGVKEAFFSHPEITLKLLQLFKVRFDPEETSRREESYRREIEETRRLIEGYNTGHQYLDEIRRTVFRTCLLFIQGTLKTNFFVPDKHCLAFRIDPAYLDELGPTFTSDLPGGKPFRITFFFGRHGAGYHVGFSDIARGGWRTVICRSRDDFITAANTLFREVFVLAHTQHLKNKDIYEGGSKMVLLLDALDLDSTELVTQRLYKLQYGMINAFFDIFVTEDGRARHPRVVDYYGEDEPIELGPDENMHDAMVEFIAGQSVKRGYLLGNGVISSKRVGINHREYGVTSTGVTKFAEIALAELDIDIYRDPFTVKFTGGPNGDVAGNCMRIMLERCPQVKILLIVDGTGAVCDPQGIDRKALQELLLRQDLDRFPPQELNPGGFILYRQERRREDLRELYKKVVRVDSGPEVQWITVDAFHRELEGLIFTVPADLFLPGGGRPETVNESNWHRFFGEDGSASVRVIVEGANSFITPKARTAIQEKGVVLLRDASANKCGVISSSYEIIANLLMSDKEFMANKAEYVRDVLEILEKRAGDEARLILARRRESGGKALYTDISDGVSREINDHYARFFDFFQAHPLLSLQPLFRDVLMAHLPRLLRKDAKCRRRIGSLPAKYRYAILAAEIATLIVYRGGWEPDLESTLRNFLKKQRL